MKFLCDSTLFDAETGRCWKSTDSFTGYGNGYPEKIVIHNFEDLEDKPKLLYLEHIQYAEMHRKYYQRRTRQNNLLSVMFICRGEMYFHCEEDVLLAEAGDCVLLKPHCRNDFLYLPGKKCAAFEIILNGSGLDGILQLYRLEQMLWCRIPDRRPFFDLLKRTGKLRSLREPIAHRLAGCALEVIQLLSQAGADRSSQSSIAQIRDELESRLHEKVNMGEIARKYSLCLPVLNRRFREAFGTTPYRYWKQFRLKRGAELLNRGLLIKEAAGMVGYENPKSFSAEFRRFYGISPQAYRGNSLA